jgi:hypothetical protein
MTVNSAVLLAVCLVACSSSAGGAATAKDGGSADVPYCSTSRGVLTAAEAKGVDDAYTCPSPAECIEGHAGNNTGGGAGASQAGGGQPSGTLSEQQSDAGDSGSDEAEAGALVPEWTCASGGSGAGS